MGLINSIKVLLEARKEVSDTDKYPLEKNEMLYAAIIVTKDDNESYNLRCIGNVPNEDILAEKTPFVTIPMAIALEVMRHAMDLYNEIQPTDREIRQMLYVDLQEGTIIDAFEKLIEERKQKKLEDQKTEE